MFTLTVPLSSFVLSGGSVFTDSLDNAVVAIPSLDPIYDSSTLIEELDPADSRVEFRFNVALTGPQQSALNALIVSYDGQPGFTGFPGNYQVANLPLRGFNLADSVWALDGRKVGEGPGSGTGVPVYWSGNDWRVFSTDTPVQV